MTVDIGCRKCGERRRDIKSLLSRARHDEWAGRPVGPIREQIAALRRQLAVCDHRVTQPLREAAGKAGPTRVKQPMRGGRTGVLALPELKPGRVRCPVCRNGASLTSYGYLRAHRDPSGHACHNRATT